jgi:murein DD-endopeptidase MepM/ murein hydrolase activator NlpD
MRRSLSLFGLVLVVAASAAAGAHADGGTTTTTTTTDTTTTSTTTVSSTTTTSETTTTAETSYAPLVRSRLGSGCAAGVAALASSSGAASVLSLSSSGHAAAYPGSHPFLTLDAASGWGCGARVSISHVSLFDGTVTARSVWGRYGNGKVLGLAINGMAVYARSGQTVAVGNWGLLELGARSGRLSAPLALRLVRSHGSLAAGTTIYVAFSASQLQVSHPKPKKKHHTPAPVTPVIPKHPGPHYPGPTTWTPRLGIPVSHYVFPVAGGASYVDTFGAGRPDIYDGWHHGDDLFAPLGTPVVAVANGKLSPIGWDGLGGWRLWLTDNNGNSFYYAHLAGYSRAILTNRTVKAGQVIGFLGRTGDAFTTAPHLHFEIHPHNKKLVARGYDGAVNPTTYLQSWRIEKVKPSKIPAAARLVAPAGTPSMEAAVVWKELIKARHLMPDGSPIVARTPSVRRPIPGEDPKDAAYIDTRRLASQRRLGDALRPSSSPWPLITLGFALAAFAVASSFVVVRRRRSA